MATVLCAIITSCSSNKSSFTLSGKFKGLNQGEFICFSSSSEWGTLDTVRIVDGKFSLTHPLADTVILTLQYPNFMQTRIVAIPGEEVVIRGDAANMREIEITPEPPAAWAALIALEEEILRSEHTNYNRIAKSLDEIRKKGYESPRIREYENLILNAQWQIVNGQCRVGKRLPAFKVVTLRGDTITSLKGQWVLVTFWSTMAPEYISPLTETNRVIRKKQKKLSMVNICLDADTIDCMRVLHNDTIVGYNVCDRRSFDSPLVHALGLRALPSNILVDNRGVIRERDIPIDKLESTLTKYGF
ncbi:MAG: DUF4369 domain-containing protein [Bacteroidaceae bacterium]|nr:DUF4369 domain-containing protein [Bacteroidaceae bacterium]